MRAPIQSITMISNRLIEKQEDVLSRTMLKAVHHASQMMAFLMDDLLDFQLFEHGKFIPRLEDFCIGPVISELIETLES